MGGGDFEEDYFNDESTRDDGFGGKRRVGKQGGMSRMEMN
jgi:hypothetical protein